MVSLPRKCAPSLSLEPGSSLMGGTQGRQRSCPYITFASRGRFPVRATVTVTRLQCRNFPGFSEQCIQFVALKFRVRVTDGVPSHDFPVRSGVGDAVTQAVTTGVTGNPRSWPTVRIGC